MDQGKHSLVSHSVLNDKRNAGASRKKKEHTAPSWEAEEKPPKFIATQLIRATIFGY
jgi:hypothetical protein